ncbi:hypothetical protein FKW77_008287 [Venturia effusa]|uniref:Uncharacterized protein n=1 Tax=Venturia effusa TaxID=50376 RepID=A0A517L7S0_9PEZI|nr:hypothetical protein FKW77_008287 [Venturia effusa]
MVVLTFKCSSAPAAPAPGPVKLSFKRSACFAPAAPASAPAAPAAPTTSCSPQLGLTRSATRRALLPANAASAAHPAQPSSSNSSSGIKLKLTFNPSNSPIPTSSTPLPAAPIPTGPIPTPPITPSRIRLTTRQTPILHDPFIRGVQKRNRKNGTAPQSLLRNVLVHNAAQRHGTDRVVLHRDPAVSGGSYQRTVRTLYRILVRRERDVVRLDLRRRKAIGRLERVVRGLLL